MLVSWVCLRLWPEERSQPLTRRAAFQFQIFYHSLWGGREDGNPFTLSLLVCVIGSEGLLLRGAEVGGAEGSAWHVAGSPKAAVLEIPSLVVDLTA